MKAKQSLSRRDLLKSSACGFGYLAFSSMFAQLAQTAAAAEAADSLAPKPTHFPPRAKRVIFLFMHGGPSHVDTFDPKPLLTRDSGKPAPDSLRGDMPTGRNLLASPWEFEERGESGLQISSLFPEIGKMADDLCVLRGMHTDGVAHNQAVLKMHTGSENQLRPSVGSWIMYGLGSVNQDLPGFITLSPPVLNGGPQNYGAAFLPAVYQGTAIGRENASLSEAQIRHIRNPQVHLNLQRRQIDLVQKMNERHLKQAPELDSELEAAIKSYELAFRMQTEAPQLTDLSDESAETLRRYGVNEGATDNFGRQCLLARRFAESGVRFIQVNHAFRWDQHANLKSDMERNAAEVDRPIAALLEDLKERGLLNDTLVLWGGEFGRTPTAQQEADGRDHNPYGFSMWLAGGGVRGGTAYGATDDYGFRAVENKVHIHDLHATLLHLLGLDHKKLTFRHAGRDYRLTDVHGEIVKAILS